MIKKYSLLALQKAIGYALALDETSSCKLKALEGKVLKIMVRPLQVHFFLLFQQGELQLLEEEPSPPDTIIQSSPLGLIRLSLLPASKVRSLFNDKIHISGDLDVGLHVKNLFDTLDIDWEGHLAHFTGDVVAHQLGGFFRQGMALTQRVTSSLRANVTEYVQEEVGLFPTREAVDDFFNDVDTLTLQTERLAARIQQWQARYHVD